MIGTIWVNVIVGGAVMILTLLFSSMNNVFLTALTRSFYSFVIVFLAVFPLRWVIGYILNPSEDTSAAHSESNTDDANKGQAIDLTTPDDQPAQDRLKTQDSESVMENEFQPITPPKLASKNKQNVELMAQALRSMSEE